jgi:hypothetical protein
LRPNRPRGRRHKRDRPLPTITTPINNMIRALTTRLIADVQARALTSHRSVCSGRTRLATMGIATVDAEMIV